MAVFDTYIAEVERACRAGARDEPNWLMTARRRAAQRFREVGFPTSRDEEWRFTSVASIAETPFSLAQDGASQVAVTELERVRVPGATVSTLVCVSARYVGGFSDLRRVPPGVSVGSLSQVGAEPAGFIQSHLTRLAPVERNAF